MSAFMAQAGNRLWCFGDTGDALGNSLYEARLFVRGKVNSSRLRLRRKADARRAQQALAKSLLERAGADGQVDPSEFRRYGSAQQLYRFHMDNLGAY